jgi:hypothetical protein
MTTQSLSAVDALELAMYLAVTAPTKQKAQRCTDIAIGIASELDADVVRASKRRVAQKLKDESKGDN